MYFSGSVEKLKKFDAFFGFTTPEATLQQVTEKYICIEQQQIWLIFSQQKYW